MYLQWEYIIYAHKVCTPTVQGMVLVIYISDQRWIKLQKQKDTCTPKDRLINPQTVNGPFPSYFKHNLWN